MQNKGFKIVLKRNSEGRLFGATAPVCVDEQTRHLSVSIIRYFDFSDYVKSVRLVVENKVFEAHTDKYKNVILRIYEK